MKKSGLNTEESNEASLTDYNQNDGETTSSPGVDWGSTQWSPRVVLPEATVDQDVGSGQKNEGNQTSAEQPAIMGSLDQ